MNHGIGHGRNRTFFSAHHDMRMATFLIYLTDADGGETVFPRVLREDVGTRALREHVGARRGDGGQAPAPAAANSTFSTAAASTGAVSTAASVPPQGRDLSELLALCRHDAVLKIAPVKGSAILFYSSTPAGAIDPQALHAGCPVRNGDKWIAQQWVHKGRYAGAPYAGLGLRF